MPDGSFMAVYKNGSGYRTVDLETWSWHDGILSAKDVDGNQHVWTTGSDVHIKERKSEVELGEPVSPRRAD